MEGPHRFLPVDEDVERRPWDGGRGR